MQLVALGQRFGYHRTLPTMAWANVSGVVEGLAPGRLAPFAEQFAGVPAVDLLDEARAAIGVLCPAD